MKNRLISILLLLLIVLGIYSCAKYKDVPAVQDPRLTNPYCNDPAAVNYNWGFPGKPDNTICFYPTDVFSGVWQLNDSIFFDSSGLFVRADTFLITIAKKTDTTMSLQGFCASGNLLQLTARLSFPATIDTTIIRSDSLVMGQPLCITTDTVNGTITQNIINDSIIYIAFQVWSDTGVITSHLGTARLLHK